MNNLKLADLKAHQTSEWIITRLESFGHEFERLARTAKQTGLAERFNNTVHDIAEARPLTAADHEPLWASLQDYGNRFEQLARTPEQKQLAAAFGGFIKEVAGPPVKDAFQKPLVNELIEELKAVMREGSSNRIPFSTLSLQGKKELLSVAVDWTNYFNRGLSLSGENETTRDGIERIIENAVAGNPSVKWMERAELLPMKLEEILDCQSTQHVKPAEKETRLLLTGETGMENEYYSAEELANLFKEIRADEAAGKREDAHWYRKESLKELVNEKTKAQTAEKDKDRGIER